METIKIIKALRKSIRLIKNVGCGDLKVTESPAEIVRVNLYYFLKDLSIELGVDVDEDKLKKEIFG